MNTHLKPSEIVDALDGALALPRRAHLDSCATCAREVAALGRVHRDVAESADPHEPSPLFWSHFSDRLREAVRDEPLPGWRWAAWWRPAVALAAIALVAVLVGVLPWQSPEEALRPAAPVLADAGVDLDEAGWGLVVDAASDFETDQVREMIVPRAGTADRLIDALSVEERREFVRLLRAEMGSLE
jgi:hypothetical protein